MQRRPAHPGWEPKPCPVCGRNTALPFEWSDGAICQSCHQRRRQLANVRDGSVMFGNLTYIQPAVRPCKGCGRELDGLRPYGAEYCSGACKLRVWRANLAA